MKKYKEELSTEEVKQLPLQAFQGKIHLVEKRAQLSRLKGLLQQNPVLGFDTETKPNFRKGRRNKVALLQLSAASEAWLIRLHKVGLPKTVIRVFENPGIKKVGVAIHDDIKALQGLRKFEPRGFIDLQDYVEHFGIKSKGLRKLSGIILGFRISKSQQTSNWENGSLTPEQQRYAATDAWVSHRIYTRLNHQA